MCIVCFYGYKIKNKNNRRHSLATVAAGIDRLVFFIIIFRPRNVIRTIRFVLYYFIYWLNSSQYKMHFFVLFNIRLMVAGLAKCHWQRESNYIISDQLFKNIMFLTQHVIFYGLFFLFSRIYRINKYIYIYTFNNNLIYVLQETV